MHHRCARLRRLLLVFLQHVGVRTRRFGMWKNSNWVIGEMLYMACPTSRPAGCFSVRYLDLGRRKEQRNFAASVKWSLSRPTQRDIGGTCPHHTNACSRYRCSHKTGTDTACTLNPPVGAADAHVLYFYDTCHTLLGVVLR